MPEDDFNSGLKHFTSSAADVMSGEDDTTAADITAISP